MMNRTFLFLNILYYFLLHGCAPWLTAIKNFARTGKGPGDARSKNKKIKFLAIERQIEKRDGNPFK